MSVNKYKTHVWILPEDRANEQLANGFFLRSDHVPAAVQVLPPLGGWPAVLDALKETYVPKLHRFPLGHVLLLLDFDDNVDRLQERVAERVPPDLTDRVFTLGVLTTPEGLKQETQQGGLERLGWILAENCPNGLWEHPLLAHNSAEVERLRDSPCGPLLIGS